MLDTMTKLHAIEEQRTVYNIHYCRAGVGFILFDPPEGFKDIEVPIPWKVVDGKAVRTMSEGEHRSLRDAAANHWKQHLKVMEYYPTFEEAVDAEYERLSVTASAPDAAAGR